MASTESRRLLTGWMSPIRYESQPFALVTSQREGLVKERPYLVLPTVDLFPFKRLNIPYSFRRKTAELLLWYTSMVARLDVPILDLHELLTPLQHETACV